MVLLCQLSYAIKTQLKAPKAPYCLYGIRELASAIPRTCLRTSSGPVCSAVQIFIGFAEFDWKWSDWLSCHSDHNWRHSWRFQTYWSIHKTQKKDLNDLKLRFPKIPPTDWCGFVDIFEDLEFILLFHLINYRMFSISCKLGWFLNLLAKSVKCLDLSNSGCSSSFGPGQPTGHSC